MSRTRSRWLAAAAVLAVTAAWPLAAYADDGQGQQLSPHCARVLAIAQAYPRLADSFPGLKAQIAACTGTQGAQQGGDDQFDDLGGYAWAQADISFLHDLGVIQGEGHHRYAPGDVLSRAQFAALLQRVFVLPQPATPVDFIDVQPGAWDYAAAEAAAPYMGDFPLPGGVAFEPSLPVVRVEVAAAIGKIEVQSGAAQLPSAAQAQAVWAAFSDGSQVPAGLAQYAAVAVQLGIMQGFPNGRFGVNDTLTRAQAAVLLARVLRASETLGTGAGGSGTATGSTLTGTIAALPSGSIVLTVNGSPVTLTLAPSVTVTVNGQSASLSQLTAGESVTVTLNAQGQVTAIAASGPSVAQTVSGFLVGDTATAVTLATYGSGGPALTTYTLDSGAQVTENGQAVAPTALALGDAVSVGLDASGGAATVTATAPSGSVTRYTGVLVGLSGGQASLLNPSTGAVTNVALGASPVTVVGGSFGSAKLDQPVTIDTAALNGSALVVQP
jgi:hypothetical protein